MARALASKTARVAEQRASTPPPSRASRAPRAHEVEASPIDVEGSEGWRRTWSLMKLVAGVVLVLGISLGVAWGAHHYALTTSRFAIEQVEVQGARRLSSEQVANLAGIQVGQNIFKVDMAEAERRLVAHPWIQGARVTRQLPRELFIEVTEFEARAIASIGDQLFLVTRTGEPFKALVDSDPFDIPVVTGISQENLARDRARETERIKVALEVLGHYERLPLSHAFPAQEIHLADSGAVTLVVGRQGVSMKLGKGPWLTKLRMAERVMAKVQRQGKVPGILFLDNAAHEERVVVRMR